MRASSARARLLALQQKVSGRPATPATPVKQGGLSAAASLFIGVGLGTLVLALAAFLLLRQ